MNQKRKFTSINERFTCEVCQKEVPPLAKGCRNHCPYCLHSKHVDINPGDRLNDCKGTLKPIGYKTGGKTGITLIFSCLKCGEITHNIAAHEDAVEPDDYDVILKLTPSIQ